MLKTSEINNEGPKQEQNPGLVLTARLIIFFQMTADRSDRITWQAWTATQTDEASVHTRKMTASLRQTPSLLIVPRTGWSTRPLALSVNHETLRCHCSIQTSNWEDKLQDPVADGAAGSRPCVCLSVLMGSSPALPSHPASKITS